MKLIDDTKAEWRKTSTWLSALGGVLMAAWVAMPDDLKGDIPHHDWIALAVFGSILLAKHIDFRTKA